MEFRSHSLRLEVIKVEVSICRSRMVGDHMMVFAFRLRKPAAEHEERGSMQFLFGNPKYMLSSGDAICHDELSTKELVSVKPKVVIISIIFHSSCSTRGPRLLVVIISIEAHSSCG
jgi:hypothetical protein